jgi:6-phosphofructokinase
MDQMVFEDQEVDAFGHKKLGGIGDHVSHALRDLSPKFNNGRRINVINQRLGYLVRCGNPDAVDSIVPMAFGNLAMDLVLDGVSGRLVNIRNGRYDNVPLEVVSSRKKIVDVRKFYNTDRLRPIYERFDTKPLFIMTSDF